MAYAVKAFVVPGSNSEDLSIKNHDYTPFHKKIRNDPSFPSNSESFLECCLQILTRTILSILKFFVIFKIDNFEKAES